MTRIGEVIVWFAYDGEVSDQRVADITESAIFTTVDSIEQHGVDFWGIVADNVEDALKTAYQHGKGQYDIHLHETCHYCGFSAALKFPDYWEASEKNLERHAEKMSLVIDNGIYDGVRQAYEMAAGRLVEEFRDHCDDWLEDYKQKVDRISLKRKKEAA